MTVKLWYKNPKGTKSKLIQKELIDNDIVINRDSNNLKFVSAVAGLGLLLRDSEYKGDLTFEKVIRVAKESKGSYEELYRAGFIKLVEAAELLEQSK